MKTTLQILEDALVLVIDGWAQHVWAQDKDGCAVDVGSPKAACFCSEGAIIRANGGTFGLGQVYERLKEAISTELTIPDWNDVPERTHEEVIAAITRAIELKKKLLEVAV